MSFSAFSAGSRSASLVSDSSSQAEFAELVGNSIGDGIDVGTISRWERGVLVPHRATRKELAAIAEKNNLPAEQGRRFLDAALEHRLGAAFMMALLLGLREGEVLGAKPEDVDLDARVFHGRRALSRIKLPGDAVGQWVERPPKRNSYLDLSMPETVCRALVRHLARREAEAAAAAGEDWHDSGYLFVSPTERRFMRVIFFEDFVALCERATVPRIRLHDTRHSCGTLLHARQLSTTRRYTHAPVEVTKAALAGLDALFASAAQQNADAGSPATVKAHPDFV